MECLGGPKEEDLAIIIDKQAAHELAKSTKAIKAKNFADDVLETPRNVTNAFREDPRGAASYYANRDLETVRNAASNKIIVKPIDIILGKSDILLETSIEFFSSKYFEKLKSSDVSSHEKHKIIYLHYYS